MANHTCSSFLRFLLFLFLLCFSKKAYAFERRETIESHHHNVEISSLLPANVCNPSTEGPDKRSSLKVVHRHGPCSQLGQDKANAPTLTQILNHDQSRVNSIHSRHAFNLAKPDFQVSKSTLPTKTGDSLGTGNYIVTVGLGTPKKDLSLIFDTGSDLTWTQCKPCVGYCYKQQQPIFDPSASTSYSSVTCNTPLCSQLSDAAGIKPPRCSGSTCLYGIQYGDRSFSVGYFGKEKLTLTSSDVFSNFIFGCGQNNRGLYGGTAGLLGLARGKLSIVSQTTRKYKQYFSYCLPSMSSSTGHLTFGKGGTPKTVKFTPMSNSRGETFYFIDIIAIYVGGSKVSINPTVFSTAGAIIDSGTVITRLPPTAYTAMRDAFRQLMTMYPMAKPLSILDTCYDFSNYTTVSIPQIRFTFRGNVNVDFDISGILYGGSLSQLCLALAGNSDASDFGIFGNVQQSTLEVVYDVAGRKLGFGPGGCD